MKNTFTGENYTKENLYHLTTLLLILSVIGDDTNLNADHYSKMLRVITVMNCLMRWLRLPFDFDSTTVPLLVKGH